MSGGDRNRRSLAILYQVAWWSDAVLQSPAGTDSRLLAEESLRRALADLDGVSPGWLERTEPAGSDRRQGRRR